MQKWNIINSAKWMPKLFIIRFFYINALIMGSFFSDTTACSKLLHYVIML